MPRRPRCHPRVGTPARRLHGPDPFQPPVADPGLVLLRTLADKARLGQFGLAGPQLILSPIRTYGIVETERLLWDYLNTFSPKLWSTDEGDQFAAWFSALHADRAAGETPSLPGS